MNCTAHCPKCGKASITTSSVNTHAYYCHTCKMEFEDSDDGEVTYGNPARIASHIEQRRIARQAWLERQRARR